MRSVQVICFPLSFSMEITLFQLFFPFAFSVFNIIMNLIFIACHNIPRNSPLYDTINAGK